ncbi:aspartate aminotransferase family protein [Bacillus gobiensis]|uniref:aspartate aminotransferase family protein n=1 Tax=Bacillus gobiensis TaxID=1441095 RepID=UPI003D24B073
MKSYLIKPELNGEYPIAVHADGVYIYDADEKKYLDGSSGAVTCNIGHGVKEIIDPLYDQLKNLSFVYRSQFSNLPAEQLAEELANLLPGDLTRSFFVNSGSEAIETAMKIAIQYWQDKNYPQKTKFISRWNSYHGITNGALALSGFYERRVRFTHMIEHYPAVSAPNCYRCPYQLAYPECGIACAQELEKAIHRIGKSNVAAFVAEPIVGAAGAAITPPEGYYEKIKKICEKNDVLFIADEVMTGIGRTGKWLAIEHWNVEPDIVALGKGISGGYAPIAATVVSDSIIQVIENSSRIIMSGHTFSANPFSARAGLEVIRYSKKNNVCRQAELMGEELQKQLRTWMLRTKIIGDIRGKGLLIGVEFVRNKETKDPFPPEFGLTEKIVKEAKKRGLLLYPSSAGLDTAGNAVIISPPLTISKKEMQELFHLFQSVIQSVEITCEKEGRL